MRVGNIALDQRRGLIACGDETQPLSALEYRLMELFALNPGICFSAGALLERIWGLDSDAEEGSVWVYISYLRKKLSAVGANVCIRAARNQGYSLECVEGEL